MLFFGRTGNLEKPSAVEKGICSNKLAFGFTDFPLGVLHNSIKIIPNEEKKIVIILGMVRDEKDAQRIRNYYMVPETAEKALIDVRNFWNNYVEDNFVVKTPEKEIDRLVNIWIKYQHRSSMLQNLNNGLRGLGIWCPAYPYGGGKISDIRETGNVPCDLELIREDIIDFLQGTHIPLMLKSDIELRWKPQVTSGPSLPYPPDGRALWPYPVCWYIKETGDLSFLDFSIYSKGHPWSPKTEKSTVFECMNAAISWFLSGLSERGLPRLNPGYGDWNDALNLISREGKGESILTAMELCYMLKECAEIAKAYGKQDAAEYWMKKYEHIKSAINKYAWDGNWYIRAFTDEGEPVGSSKNEEGKIYLSVQAWAVLSGVADEERSQKCLQSVDELLMTEFGPRICSPPYTKPDYHIGIVADFGPGWRENGGIWNRTTGWAVMANCLANRANQAFEMYKKASLHNVSKDVNRFWLPPYAYPEYYVGAGPDFGRGQFQWCTGKAGTMWRAFVYYILGVRPLINGLLVDPKIPNNWEGFTLMRRFRDAIYKIEVSNPNQANMGVKSMIVDGKVFEGNVLPIFKDKKIHEIKVVLGK
jgi:cellobiose phosphorylase